MRLDEYAQKHGRGSIVRLADKAGVHNARLYEILKGHVPTVKLAKRIAEASDGAITAADLLGLTAPTVTIDQKPRNCAPAQSRRVRKKTGRRRG